MSSPACTITGVRLSARFDDRAAVSRVRRNCVVTIVSTSASASAIDSSSARARPASLSATSPGGALGLLGMAHQDDDLRMVGGRAGRTRGDERERQNDTDADD